MYERIKRFVKKVIPKKLIDKNEALIRRSVAVFYKGNKYSCNICDFKMSRFIELSNGERLCPRCGSLPRTRRLYSVLKEELESGDKKILHFSPPKGLVSRLKKYKSINYITTDYAGEFTADLQLDITDIKEEDNSYQVIICYHVLEHIEDDIRAMKELHRILDKGGKCLIQTPFKEGDIYEDPNVKTPEERLAHFGQDDHVRIYSVKGLKERLISAGFDVKTLKFDSGTTNEHGFKPEEVVLMGCKN